MSILAGSTLGGGTVVNYMNCIRTPQPIREEWAAMGVEGIDQPDYERHIDSIWERLSVNEQATAQNATHQKLIEACETLGYPHRALTRNADIELRGPDGLRLLLRGLPEGLQAVDDEDVPAGRRRCRRTLRRRLPRRSDPRRGRPRGRRRGDGHPRGRLDDRADRQRAERDRRLRRDRVAGAAAALGHRRPGRRQAPAPAPGRGRRSASTTSRSKAGSGRSSRRCRTSSSTARATSAS